MAQMDKNKLTALSYEFWPTTGMMATQTSPALRISTTRVAALIHISTPTTILAQFCVRSNMDIKIRLLRNADARGLLFYILNYATKSEQTLGSILVV